MLASHAATTLFATITVASVLPGAKASDGGFDRGGWIARIPPSLHQVEAVVRMVDERTVQVDHFTYDGSAPLVYFYFGAFDNYDAFLNGLQVEPLLDRPYIDESLTLTLPEGESLLDYRAISVWCAEFSVNFGSAQFTCGSDFDFNFTVNTADLITLLGDWGDVPTDAPTDIDQSGAVDTADLLHLLGDWGICF